MGTSSMTPLPHTHTRVGAIIGGVIGGIVGVLAICGLVVYLLYRRRQQKRAVRDEIEPEEAVQEAKPSTIDPFTYASVSQVASSSESRQVLNVGHMRSLSSPEPETSSLSRSAITTSTAPLTSKKARAETPSSGLRSTATSTEPPSPPPNSESFRTSPTSGYYGGASQFGELSRQIREMEQTVAELRRRQSTDHRATASLMASTQPSIIGSFPRDDVEIRREIVALQVEVERLRAEQALLSQEAPPAYEPREDEDAGGEAQLE
ncbi:hypothetical protein EVJ58_g9406 [Rhodofomes roseus]|uniref:Uncharacterized protein n=1 Tax=Rhodofomes roseus TaxID=34475 RepID=A0A4Y9XTC4_9APHY|nr:hypothetical protein EVJ58_g9406 [Rhodofomes roseus]